MDEIRSTTPPLPPPATSETLHTEAPSQSQPTSAQPETQEDPVEPNQYESQETKMDPNRLSKLPRPANSRTPEPARLVQPSNLTNGHGHAATLAQAAHIFSERSCTPETPGGSLSPFDWDDLEVRFAQALADANKHEEELMAEFGALVKYFNIWASTASARDNERAAKR